MPALLERGASANADKPLIRFGEEVRTFGEMRDRAARFAGALIEANVQPGDRVAVLCANRLEVVDVWLATGWCGAIMVPINASLRGLQLDHVLTNSDPRVFVIDAGLLERLDYVETVPASLERLWVVGGEPRPWRNVPAEPFPDSGRPSDAHPVRPGDTAAIIYTGGTTGPPKGVMCSHGQCAAWGANLSEHLGVTADSVLYTSLPLFHTNALNTLSQALVSGATFVCTERFSASRFWAQAREAGATHSYLIGAMITMLLRQPPSPDDNAHAVRTILGPAAPRDAVEPFETRFGVRLIEAYGSTETNMPICSVRGPYKRGAMGSIVEGFEARIVDEDDVDLPTGEPGELILRHSRPDAFAAGYWRMPEQTVKAWRNLWFHTGDRAIRDEDGVFWFVDRMAECIRRRGENISSFEVETVVGAHPDVLRAAVVPVPSDLGEDEVMAYVLLRDGAKPDAPALMRYCEPRLAHFAIPRYVEFVNELPLTEVGRVRKYVLRERGVSPTAWDREAAGYSLSSSRSSAPSVGAP